MCGDDLSQYATHKDWNWLEKPVKFSEFQGIRYLDRLPELKEKLLEGGVVS